VRIFTNGLSTPTTERSGCGGLKFKKSSELIERLTATLILTPFAPATRPARVFYRVKCFGEDNVIDPL